jgi:uncharacterized protein YecT (DUF1311 family)
MPKLFARCLLFVAISLIASVAQEKAAPSEAPVPPKYSLAWQDVSPCWKAATNQRAREYCASKDLKETDDEMSGVYHKLLAKYNKQPAVESAIKEAQRKWIAYRDSFLNSYFPNVTDIRNVWGSQMAECAARYDIAITIERTKWFRQMLDPSDIDTQPQQYADLCAFPF